MVSHRRNTEGLKGHAQQKRKQALERTEAGIRKLLKEGRPITFETVSEVSEVSRAWLYNQPEIRVRIEQLRDQQPGKKTVARNQRASELSNVAVVKTLKEQIKKLRAENQGLRQHIEEVLGRCLYADEQVVRYQREVEGLKAEVPHLKQQLVLPDQVPPLVSVPGQANESVPMIQVRDQVEADLTQLGVVINSTLRKVMQSASEETVLEAIAVLKEAISAGAIERPGGWLKRAIEGAWQPNGSYAQTSGTSNLTLFNEWFSLARSKGLAIASTKNEGEINILMSNDEWLPFTEALSQYPVETLRG